MSPNKLKFCFDNGFREKTFILYPDLQSKDTSSKPTNPDPPITPTTLSIIEFKNFYFYNFCLYTIYYNDKKYFSKQWIIL